MNVNPPRQLKSGTYRRQSWIQPGWPYCFSPVHTADKVKHISDKDDRIGDRVDRVGDRVDRVSDSVDLDKLSNSSSCRFVAETGDRVDYIGNSRLCHRFQQQSTLSPTTGLKKTAGTVTIEWTITRIILMLLVRIINLLCISVIFIICANFRELVQLIP